MYAPGVLQIPSMKAHCTDAESQARIDRWPATGWFISTACQT